MRRILFLDIDGILNSHSSVLRQFGWPLDQALCLKHRAMPMEELLTFDISKDHAFFLEFINTMVPGLEIVISSSRKNHNSLETLQELFHTRLGLKGLKVIDVTPRVCVGQKFSERVPRIAQINQWVIDHQVSWAECVIIDDHHIAPNLSYDDPVPSRWLPKDRAWEERFIWIDQRDGLTYARACDVIGKFLGWANFKAPEPNLLGF